MAEIRYSTEMHRILNLPRRRYDDPEYTNLAQEMTEVLKTPGGTMTLRWVQAMALHDIALHGGGFLPLGVGLGKTAVSLLAPYVTSAKRPLLILPATLMRKTEREIPFYRKHFLVPDNIKLISYEILGRVQAAHDIEKYAPDLIVADELHKLRNRKAAVTRRVARYLHDHPETKFVGMSGTIMRRSLVDFGHLIRWCLRGNAPVPKTEAELEEWAQALDEKIDAAARFRPGALLELCAPEDRVADSLTAARRGFQRRLSETPGVVVSAHDGESVDASIYIKAITYTPKPITEAHFEKLRSQWLTPDDWLLYQPVDVWRHAKELSLGLHYIWSPRPPDAWRNARRDWHAFVREVLSRSRTLDSELDVANACDAGKLPADVLKAWRTIRDTFKPNTVAVWHDDTVLKLCVEWMKKPGIVWTNHSFFARRLAEVSGCTYYGAEGLSDTGAFIEDADPKSAVIASSRANREGRNLQTKWNRNLVMSPADGADAWQQLIGRTHRPGQTEDEVTFDVFLGCLEHVNAWRKALADAQAIRDTVGGQQKLLLADIDWPTDEEIALFSGSRWLNTPAERI